MFHVSGIVFDYTVFLFCFLNPIAFIDLLELINQLIYSVHCLHCIVFFQFGGNLLLIC